LPRARDSALELWVEPIGPGAAPLARGLVLGSSSAFRSAATQRGGFQSGGQGGDIELSVAPARGVLVIAQGALSDELVVRARRDAQPLAAAHVKVTLEGAEPASTELVTDAAGLARLALRPREPQVRAQLAASAGDARGALAARLEVVQGAIVATRRGESLQLESSGAATHAFLGFFDEKRRYAGAHVALTPAADGRLVGELPWPAGLSASPLWVVASSQPDLASPSAVGWPIVGQRAPDPQTFDAREALLLDGSRLALAREERRARRIRLVTAAYATTALLLTLILFVRRVNDAERDIERHLTEAGADLGQASLVPARKGWAVLAAACIGLGFVVLVVFALLKE